MCCWCRIVVETKGRKVNENEEWHLSENQAQISVVLRNHGACYLDFFLVDQQLSSTSTKSPPETKKYYEEEVRWKDRIF